MYYSVILKLVTEHSNLVNCIIFEYLFIVNVSSYFFGHSILFLDIPIIFLLSINIV